MADAHGGGEEGGGHWLGLSMGIIVIIAIVAVLIFGLATPFTPTFLNIDYVFGKILIILQAVVSFFVDYNVGMGIKAGIGIIVVFLIALNFYLFIRLLEMEDEHEDHVYHHADDTTKPHSMLRHVLNDAKELGSDIASIAKPVNRATDKAADLFNKAIYMEDADLVDPSSATPDNSLPHEVDEKEGSSKWRMVLKHMNSKNPSDWKLAIIEADTILDALVERAGFPGETLGERLKNADRGVFQTLDFAWESHKVRNRIAHEGSNFVLSERDAKKTIQQCEEVFKEFQYI